MISDLTVIVCAYKATKELKLCLHQLVRYNIKPSQLLIYENSPESYRDNRDFLDSCNIEYVNNPGGRHAETVNVALRMVTTKYALILDSDCFCISNPEIQLNYVKEHNIQLYGDICGDRYKWHIYKRVHPWYCFVDVEFLNNHNIWFYDESRIAQTNSWSFFDISKLNGTDRTETDIYYDVGSTMFEDVIAANGVCADIGNKKPYIHLEGSSWQKDSNVDWYDKHIKLNEEYLEKLYSICKYDETFFQLLDKKLI